MSARDPDHIIAQAIIPAVALLNEIQSSTLVPEPPTYPLAQAVHALCQRGIEELEHQNEDGLEACYACAYLRAIGALVLIGGCDFTLTPYGCVTNRRDTPDPADALADAGLLADLARERWPADG